MLVNPTAPSNIRPSQNADHRQTDRPRVNLSQQHRKPHGWLWTDTLTLDIHGRKDGSWPCPVPYHSPTALGGFDPSPTASVPCRLGDYCPPSPAQSTVTAILLRPRAQRLVNVLFYYLIVGVGVDHSRLNVMASHVHAAK